jgi:hypothetical protein
VLGLAVPTTVLTFPNAKAQTAGTGAASTAAASGTGHGTLVTVRTRAASRSPQEPWHHWMSPERSDRRRDWGRYFSWCQDT